MSSSDQAFYRAIPELSPYTSGERYHLEKEDHKTYLKAVKELPLFNQSEAKVCDLGCANGELIYFLKSKLGKKWDFTGYDYTPEFIDTAKKFPGLDGVHFEVRDMYEVSGKYDLVLCSGVTNTQTEIIPLLNKTVSLCSKGGTVLIDGLFNKFNVEVRLQFRDHSVDSSKDLWRTGLNQFSRESIKTHLQTITDVKDFEFTDMPMGVDLPHNPEKPATTCFTFKDASGSRLITNGLNVIIRKTLLRIELA